MGVLNITPDSFSDGGVYFNNSNKAIDRAKEMIADGADVIDVGGESTRPGSKPITEAEELRRVLPIIGRLAREVSVPISIDTYKPQVAYEALQHGATIMNDITGLTNPEMLVVAAKFKQPVIIMHMQGRPKTMQKNPFYQDVIEDIKNFFQERINAAHTYGIEKIILDPGIGFGKNVMHNLTILKRLNEFSSLGYPILVGPSRKSFIGTITNKPITERLPGTVAAVIIAVLGGARMIRVHDVAACRQALQILTSIQSA